jgi:hypothetical protein
VFKKRKKKEKKNKGNKKQMGNREARLTVDFINGCSRHCHISDSFPLPPLPSPSISREDGKRHPYLYNFSLLLE